MEGRCIVDLRLLFVLLLGFSSVYGYVPRGQYFCFYLLSLMLNYTY